MHSLLGEANIAYGIGRSGNSKNMHRVIYKLLKNLIQEDEKIGGVYLDFVEDSSIDKDKT